MEDHHPVEQEGRPLVRLVAVRLAASSIVDNTLHSSGNHHKLRRDPDHQHHSTERIVHCNLLGWRLQVDPAVVEPDQNLLRNAGRHIRRIHHQHRHNFDGLDSLHRHNLFAEEGSL